MRNRFLKVCVLFMSLALAALPVQQAFAAQMTDPAPDMTSTHCQDSTTSDQVTIFSTASSISNGCCCDHCDASCAPDCGSSLSVSAIMLPATSAIADAAHPVYISHYPHFTTRSSSPPSPPPLS